MGAPNYTLIGTLISDTDLTSQNHIGPTTSTGSVSSRSNRASGVGLESVWDNEHELDNYNKGANQGI